MDLTLEDLAEVYRRELVSRELSELPEEFYPEVAKLIFRLREAERGDALREELLEEQLKQIIFFVNEIHATRVIKAIDGVASGDVPKATLERERTAFLEIRQSLERLRSELVAPAISGKVAIRVPVERTKATVMMLVNLNQRILGTDQRYYGPFKRGEVVNLPEANAEFMVKHDYARRIKVRV